MSPGSSKSHCYNTGVVPMPKEIPCLLIERASNKCTLSSGDIPTFYHQTSWSHLIIDQSYSKINSYSSKIRGYHTKCNDIYFQQLENLICRPDHGVPLIYLRISSIQGKGRNRISVHQSLPSSLALNHLLLSIVFHFY